MLESDRYMSLNIFSFDVCWKKSLDIFKSLANFSYVASFLCVSWWILLKNMLYRLGLNIVFSNITFCMMNMYDICILIATRADIGAS